MEYHRTQRRSTCVPAGHVHCKNCDKSIIVPMSYAEVLRRYFAMIASV